MITCGALYLTPKTDFSTEIIVLLIPYTIPDEQCHGLTLHAPLLRFATLLRFIMWYVSQIATSFRFVAMVRSIALVTFRDLVPFHSRTHA